jgi:hypothetical protein
MQHSKEIKSHIYLHGDGLIGRVCNRDPSLSWIDRFIHYGCPLFKKKNLWLPCMVYASCMHEIENKLTFTCMHRSRVDLEETWGRSEYHGIAVVCLRKLHFDGSEYDGRGNIGT